MTCSITADRDDWRGAVTEREAALVEALGLLLNDCGYHLKKYRPVQFEAARLVYEAARAHTAPGAGGE